MSGSEDNFNFTYCVFTYIHSFLIDKDLREYRNVCLRYALLSGEFFIFAVTVIHFYSCFCVIRTSVLSFSTFLFKYVFSIFNRGQRV